MYLIKKTTQFHKWIKKIKDITVKAKILARLKMVELGNLGDSKRIESNISELRINFGPGYRIYYTKQSDTIIILLIGGNKSTQKKDIDKAKILLKKMEDN